MSSRHPLCFRTVVLDVDSTLSGIEGIDWLAASRGEAVAREVAAQTARAMNGDVALEQVYAARLAAVAPSKRDVAALGDAYIASVAPGARETIAAWLGSGARVVLVSGGIRSAILPLAHSLGVPDSDVHAVSIRHAGDGAYTGYDESSPLSVATGKRDVIAALALPRPILAAGDGSTDLAMREVVDSFVAFTGFVSRPDVASRADAAAGSFHRLAEIVNGG